VTTANAYIAGFIDGEGCIRISDNGALEVTVVNTCLPALEKIKYHFGGNISKRKQAVNKEQYSYRIYGDGAFALLCDIYDYLIDKQAQALVAVNWWHKRKTLGVVRIPGRRGGFTNPLRAELLKYYIDEITRLKFQALPSGTTNPATNIQQTQG